MLVFNNVLARLRRTGRTQEEASADLGADLWQTFRYVTFPAVRSAMLAGALLAFALSFDEVIVTIFTAGGVEDAADLDLPELPAGQPGRAGERRGVAAILLSVIPVYFASRLRRRRWSDVPRLTAGLGVAARIDRWPRHR